MAWSKEEKDFLVRAYTDDTFKNIAIALDKKESTVRVMAKRLGLSKKENIEADKKKCSKCGVIHPADTNFFPKDKSKNDGLHNYCKDCHRSYRLKKVVGTKKCKICRQTKSKLDFQTRKNNKDRLDTICKHCRNTKQRLYRLKLEKESYYEAKEKEFERLEIYMKRYRKIQD